MRKVHWWRHPEKPGGNFGDELNDYILRVLGIDFTRTPPSEADLVLVGSVLEHLPSSGWTGTVCGAGQLFEGSRVDLTQATVLALRGKLTAERVTGDLSGTVLGDPALLVPQGVRQFPAQYDLGIVPHWSDDTLAQRFPYGRVINPNDPPTKVITQIAQCKRIISSSLHGIIVADAYGIPRQAELFPNAVAEGGDFKYRDYASIYDDHPHFGEMWTAPQDIVQRVQQDLKRVLNVLAGKVEDVVDDVVDVVDDVVDDVEDFFHQHHRHPQISLLVPFRDNGEHRTRVWKWLRKYWVSHLHSVEVVLGRDDGFPFSKAAAVNEAASRAKGRIFVILDADAYMDSRALQDCANQIDTAVRAGQRLAEAQVERVAQPVVFAEGVGIVLGTFAPGPDNHVLRFERLGLRAPGEEAIAEGSGLPVDVALDAEDIVGEVEVREGEELVEIEGATVEVGSRDVHVEGELVSDRLAHVGFVQIAGAVDDLRDLLRVFLRRIKLDHSDLRKSRFLAASI